MRIAIATTTGFHLIHLARELIALGHDVTYYSYHPSYRIVRGGVPLEKARPQFLRLAPWSAGALFRQIASVQRECVQLMLRRMDEQMERCLEPCDVYVALSGMLGVSGAVARRKYGATVIADRGALHVLTQQELISGGGPSKLPQGYVARELFSYDIADYLMLPSINARESFESRGFPESKLLVNMYGVDLGRFAPTERAGSGPFTILFVGAWSMQKGADLLSEAARRLPDVNFLHVGMQGDCEFPIVPNFTSLGHVPNHELPRIYALADMFVLPSRQDGFGMVLLEALASGVPVVASDKTGGPDLKLAIEDGSMVETFPSGRMDEFVSAIARMREKISRKPSAGARCALSENDLENMGWRAYATRYIRAIEAVR